MWASQKKGAIATQMNIDALAPTDSTATRPPPPTFVPESKIIHGPLRARESLQGSVARVGDGL